MKAIIKEYGTTALAVLGAFAMLGILRAQLFSQSGILASFLSLFQGQAC